MDGSAEKIQVAVRVRKLLKREKDLQSLWAWSATDNSVWPKQDPSKKSPYDRVFTPDNANEDVHDGIAEPIIGSVLQGFNATIFAYGQTASGTV